MLTSLSRKTIRLSGNNSEKAKSSTPSTQMPDPLQWMAEDKFRKGM
jgi:hypothetical protein